MSAAVVVWERGWVEERGECGGHARGGFTPSVLEEVEEDGVQRAGGGQVTDGDHVCFRWVASAGIAAAVVAGAVAGAVARAGACIQRFVGDR